MVGAGMDDEEDWQYRMHMAEIGEYDIANGDTREARNIQAMRKAKEMEDLGHWEAGAAEDTGDTNFGLIT